jgi:hypothetical protein
MKYPRMIPVEQKSIEGNSLYDYFRREKSRFNTASSRKDGGLWHLAAALISLASKGGKEDERPAEGD